jgi:hypothetical protein
MPEDFVYAGSGPYLMRVLNKTQDDMFRYLRGIARDDSIKWLYCLGGDTRTLNRDERWQHGGCLCDNNSLYCLRQDSPLYNQIVQLIRTGPNAPGTPVTHEF